ncbi:MAG: flippase-like domain-containing protein [Acidobacteria bacterium]|nr:flippase-like domain-containing protein [Acidobacteriota bacterium]
MRDRLFLLARISLTALLLYLLFYFKIDWTEFRRILHQANFLWIGAAVGINYLSYFWSADRWKVILANFKIHAPFGKLTRLTFIGAFFSLFLPSMVGGDFFKAYYLARDQKQRLTTTLTSLILDRSAGFIALLVIATTFAALRSVSVQGIRVFPGMATLTSIFLLGNLIIFSRSVHRQLDAFLRRRGMTKSMNRLDAVADGLKTLGGNPTAVIKLLLISFGVQCMVVLIFWSISLALRVNVPLLYFPVFVPLVTLITMIPLTINGLGLREWIIYILFSQVGVSREECISMGLLYYLVVVLTGLPGGLLYSLYKKQDALDQPLQEAETL